jgi:ABC-2 type transport system ATP-binding protein
MTLAPTDSALAIDLAHVAKTYRGKIHALRGIEMRVARGEIFGLLGPNGAGKSTLVKILMTVVRPNKCSGMMLGKPIGHKPTLARVGYLPEHHKFPGYLTGAQVLDFYGAMAGVPKRERRRRTGELLELVSMSEWANKRVGKYSKGMRQRVGVAQALVNNPDLVVLDEPTDGVDPVGRRDIRNILAQLRDRGKTVFLNSHLLSELEMVCDRVAIIVQGRVSRQGTLDALTLGREQYKIELTPADDASDSQAITKILAPVLAEGAGKLRTGETIRIDRGVVLVESAKAGPVQPVIDAIRAGGLTITGVRAIRPSLEDLFIEAVADSDENHDAPAKKPGRHARDKTGNGAGKGGRR